MQNQNNPMQPPGGYAPPPPPAKKGMSTGTKVFIVIAIVVVVGGVVLVAAGIGGVYWLSRRAASVTAPSSSGLARSSSSSSDSDEAEAPEPTSEQASAIAGGQSATWNQQEISWTVPQRWKQDSASSNQLTWSSPGSWDAAHLIVSISPMSADFPAETSINAFYAGAQTRKANGEVNEVKWIKLDGIKGVLFRESAPEDSDSPQRLQWMGYRIYKGQTQLVNIMLASRGKDFARHEDAMYGILYSTKLAK